MSNLPFISPMLATPCREPFDHANWLFELKHDGFRAIAFFEDGHCRLISRNGYRFSDFRDLEDSIGQALKAIPRSSTARSSVSMGKAAQSLIRPLRLRSVMGELWRSNQRLETRVFPSNCCSLQNQQQGPGQ
jgi:hypothetical protein